MSESLRLVGAARERILAEDASTQFHRESAAARQARIDGEREAFLAKGGAVTVVPSGVSAIDEAEKMPKGASLNRCIAASVEAQKRVRATNAKAAGKTRKALCDDRRAKGGAE